MAAEGDRLRAERLYVEEGKSPTVIASDIGVARSTVYKWRDEGDWDARRKEVSDRIGRARAEASDDAAARTAATHRILTRLEGLAILARIALDEDVAPKDRINAVKAHADIDGWGAAFGPGGVGGKGERPTGVIELPIQDPEPEPPEDDDEPSDLD